METRRRSTFVVVPCAAVFLSLVGAAWLDPDSRSGGMVVFAVGLGCTAILGAIVAGRSGHLAGWLLLAISAIFAFTIASETYALYGLVDHPGAVPGPRYLAPLSDALFPVSYWVVGWLLIVTPTGQPLSRGWRRVVVAGGVGAAAWTSSALFGSHRVGDPLPTMRSPYAMGRLTAVFDVLGIGVMVCITVAVAGLVSMMIRFRRSAGVERQQLRCVLFGALVALVSVALAVGSAFGGSPILRDLFAGVGLLALPASIAAGVSRYRLYEIDRLVGRFVVFVTLTALITAVYASVAVLAGQVARSPVASGIGAVAAALSVAPLHGLCRRCVDRLMFGRRSEPFEMVSDLSLRLQESMSPTHALQVLVETVAADLRIPYVAVETAEGRPIASHGLPSPRQLRLPLTHQGEQVGHLVFAARPGEQALSRSEQTLVEEVGRQAAGTIHAGTLVEDLQRVRIRLVSTREEERRRLRRDLHDGLGPQLTALTLKADAARNMLRIDLACADALLAELRADTKTAIDDIRRLVYGLRPPGLDELGLTGALRQYAHACATNSGAPSITVEGEAGELPPPVEVAAYRIVTEAVTNVIRHASANRCDVTIAADHLLQLEILDDGVGLATPWRAGVGIASMRERALEIGGTCTVVRRTDRGTRVSAVLPVVGLAQ